MWHYYMCHELCGFPNTCLGSNYNTPLLVQHQVTALVLRMERDLIVYIIGSPLFYHRRVTINIKVSVVLLSQDVFTTNVATECLPASHYLIHFTVEHLPAVPNFSPSSAQKHGAKIPPQIMLGIIAPRCARFQEPVWSLSSKINTKGQSQSLKYP